MLFATLVLLVLCGLMVAGVRRGLLIRLRSDGDFQLTEAGILLGLTIGLTALAGALLIENTAWALLWTLTSSVLPLSIFFLSLPPLHSTGSAPVYNHYVRYVDRHS